MSFNSLKNKDTFILFAFKLSKYIYIYIYIYIYNGFGMAYPKRVCMSLTK